MDFYEAQDQARKKTRQLGLLFLLCVVIVMLGVGLLSSVLFSQGLKYLKLQESGLSLADFPWESFGLGALVAGGAILVPFCYKSMQLSSGGQVVANDLGGRLLDGTPSDFKEKRLLNIVEEMALASGVPVPMVYVMDNENSINAFAAGTEPTNAVIGVTRGCLDRLDREELSGVIAHEFSHILNGDMRMNMKMVGWVFGLTAIAMIGQIMLRSLSYGRVRSRNDRDSGQIIMIIIAFSIGLMVIGGLGVLCARFLQAAISRQREYLADASAVQFTRNPETIAGALEKIGGLTAGSKITAPKASEASHLFFADGGMFSCGLATHPPLEDRIKRIKKEWDGKFPEARLGAIKQNGDERVAGFAGAGKQPAGETATSAVEGSLMRDSGGLSIPPVFITAVHHPTEAQLLVFAMLVSSGGGTNGMEASHLAQISDSPEGLAQIDQWSAELDQMSSLAKTALIDLAIPTLRRMSIPAKERFITITQELTLADNKVSLFEYMLQQVIERHLVRHMEGASYAKIKYTQLSDIQSHSDALHELMRRCERNEFELTTNDISYLESALNACQHASPKVKNELIRALQKQAESDHNLTDHESELLRAVADAIGCAIPLGELIHS